MENQNAHDLAEQIAALLRENEKRSDLFLRSSLEKINQRLNDIESSAAARDPKSVIENQKFFHASQEKFSDLEELAATPVNGFQDEKACPFEPAGKPCDHCAMCSARGF